MCNVATATTILEVLSEKTQNKEVFTAFDITQAVRAKIVDFTPHKDVRNVVSNEYASRELEGYSRELCSLNISNNPQAMVYFPDEKSASDHPLVSNSTEPDEDDTDDDDSNDPDVINLTAECRINIPQKLLSQISPMGGSYDVMIDGELKCIIPDKDSRVRLSLKSFGFVGSKCRLTADSSKNLITLESVQ